MGALLWGIAAAAGVAALFIASQVAYTALRWAGVVFLLYLAWTYLRAAFGGGAPHADLTAGAATSAREAFGKGMLTDLLNPKMAAFYLTVLPLFLPDGYPPVVAGAILAGIHVLVAFAWFTVVILSAHAIRGFLTSRRGARVIDGAAGTAMLGFGLVLGLER